MMNRPVLLLFIIGILFTGSACRHPLTNPLDPASTYYQGKVKWHYETGSEFRSSPAVGSDGTVYAGDLDGTFHAAGPDGTPLWTFETGGEIWSSACVGDDGTVYVGSMDYSLYALEENGTLKWSFAAGFGIRATPALASDGTVYIGSRDGFLYALNPDGSEKWRFDAENEIHYAAAIGSDGTIYVADLYSYLYALYPDGNEFWRVELDNTPYSSPVVYKHRIYTSTTTGTLYIVENDGTVSGEIPDRAGNLSIGEGGVIYNCGADGTMYIMDTMGIVADQFSIIEEESRITFPLLADDGTFYAGSWYGVLSAVQDGSTVWSFQPGIEWGLYSSPAMDENGILYICADGIYALNTSSGGPAENPWPMFGHDARHTGRAR